MHFVFIILVDSAVGCMYVVACSSPSLISSAAIVQGSPSISHLLASPSKEEEEDFLGKKWLRRTANGRPGTDAAVPMHLKTEKDVFVRDTHRLSGQKQFHQGGRLRRLTSH